MYYSAPKEVLSIINEFFFLLGLGYRPSSINYGMRAFPSMTFVKRIGEKKWLEFCIIGADYGTERDNQPYNIFLCKYYKFFGISFGFRTRGIFDCAIDYDHTYLTVDDYLHFICDMIKSNKAVLNLLENGW